MHGHYLPPIESQPPEVEWSRDRWRHVTPKGQGCDPIIFDKIDDKIMFFAGIRVFEFKHRDAILKDNE